MNNKPQKNKSNTCLPRTSSLANAAQITGARVKGEVQKFQFSDKLMICRRSDET
jgi:hypothetical protein